jgi:hypothetical protein
MFIVDFGEYFLRRWQERFVGCMNEPFGNLFGGLCPDETEINNSNRNAIKVITRDIVPLVGTDSCLNL